MSCVHFTDAGFPIWFHPGGRKIRLRRVDPIVRTIDLCSEQVVINIVSQANLGEHSLVHEWMVVWRVSDDQGKLTSGQITLSTEDLVLAFGVFSVPTKRPIIDGESKGEMRLEPGRFFRFNEFLSFPSINGPGDDNLNVSVLITDEIRHGFLQFFSTFIF